MAAATILSTVNQTNLEKVESFLNDPLYKESIESSLNYNTRLCLERRLRLPFIDTQTGVAQNHSALFMQKRQRIPGLFPGQIYSYPRQRWRKKRRQYLSMNSRTFARGPDGVITDGDGDMHSISQIENPALQDNDSKDSQLLKDDVSKEWFYDDQDMLEIDNYEEPDQDSDLDYEETYSKRSKRKKTPARGRNDSPGTPGRKKGSGRGRKKATHSFEPTPGDPDKPFACELCGARYKTRPGLTYHYSHSHKEGASDCENSRESNATSATVGGGGPPPSTSTTPHMGTGEDIMGGCGVPPQQTTPAIPGHVYQDSYVSFLNQAPGTPARRGRPNNPPQPSAAPNLMLPTGAVLPSPATPNSTPPTLPPNLPPVPPTAPIEDPQMPVLLPEKIDLPPQSMAQPPTTSGEREKGAPPSPYCDFCLGDSRENKKTGTMEELVSCADCGRSGHPSCLLFTDNMKISVKKYSWQCIECKCCSVCGTSDNDDKLLFCDDCDRGYHMYCLSPPLNEPPEGSWSCKLCIEQFHKCKV